MRLRPILVLAALAAASSCSKDPEPAEPACPVGSLGCPCTNLGTCIRPTDGSGALCVENVCQACEAGAVGCLCKVDGTCNAAKDGTGATCTAGKCATCEAGREGCSCKPDGSCLPGMGCESGTCRYLADAPRVPADPKCYTPCRKGYVAKDGTVHTCSAEGLMDGCVEGSTCAAGSCVATGGKAPTCGSDSGCPDFQTCITGSCYSTCQVDSDCKTGWGCDRKVCRRACVANASSCASGQSCRTTDGSSGFCRPVGQPTGTPRTEVQGTFALHRTGMAAVGGSGGGGPSAGVGGDLGSSLEFSNVRTSGAFDITNEGSVWAEFTVTKVMHREFKDEGPVEETTAPMPWVTMGLKAGETTKVEKLVVKIEAGETVTVFLAGANNPTLNRWDGTLEVANAAMGVRRVGLRYVSTPDGQWAGKMHHLANFPDEGLAAWMANKGSASTLRDVGNAFIHRWAAFRAGQISYDELSAVIESTLSESWKWPLMKKNCPQAGSACYPYDNPQGFATYSTSLTQWPIPTGSNTLPFAVNLRTDPTTKLVMKGKIVSNRALQYAGDPALTLEFEQDPAQCTAGASGTVVCPLKKFDASIFVGGRYEAEAGDTACAHAAAGTFALARIPYLVPGLTAGTSLDDSTGVRYRYECRDKQLPFGTDPGVVERNQSFATSNPIPDGRTRKRQLSIVDGALVDAKYLVIVFKETFASFLGSSDSSGFSSYGVMVLQRAVADLDDQAFAGATPQDARPAPTGLLQVGCSQDVLQQAIKSTSVPGDAAGLNNLVSALVDGVTAGAAGAEIVATDPEKVHYYCQDTGLFDGGPGDYGNANDPKDECPAGSKVTFFTVVGKTQAEVAQDACQVTRVSVNGVNKANCWATLQQWKGNPQLSVKLDPVWKCTDPTQVYCAENRKNLREGKAFYRSTGAGVAFNPLRAEVEDAFRYKTRFRNRQGKSVGFSPQICPPDSDAVPYCYDPPAIEQARDRVDCALSLYTSRFADLNAASKAALRSYLKANFAFEQTVDPSLPLPVVHDGFERLLAELLIMQGDEAYTSAFASRFDLAGSAVLSFEGALFEPGGINLSGGAGYEMYVLYQAAQYYQLALDRFYALSPMIWDSIDTLGANDGFISKDSVVTYFDRLIRASSQKTRAWSEVARRYQAFNRPDLARLVIERAYTSAYLESVVLSRMMLKLGAIVLPEDRPQMAERINFAQLTYRSALLAMRDAYSGVSDNPTQFGFAPDYIPFPAIDAGDDTNAFERVLESTKAKLEVAAAKEDLALESSRAYETDAATFQSEMVSIRNEYENQLAEICGTFKVGTKVYPAIAKYAYLDKQLALLGNPCGLVGNGALHLARGATEAAVLDLRGYIQQINDQTAAVEIEKARVGTFCGVIAADAAARFASGQGKMLLSQQVTVMTSLKEQAVRATDKAAEIAEAAKCVKIAGTAAGTDCDGAAAAVAAIVGAEAALTMGTIALDTGIVLAQVGIAELETAEAAWDIGRECPYALIESDAKVKELMQGFAKLRLDTLKGEYEVRQAVSEVVRLTNEAERVLAEQQESEQLTINIEAARNDPNVRIYKNDAILAADRTFQDALREAYKLTKVFEYYTSQSYEHLGDLYLVRMVAHGDISLEAYVARLENAFGDFEERYGNPDLRVAVVSLRDDVLAIPRLNQDGKPLSEDERLELFRKDLGDVVRLDDRGYLTLPFRTEFSSVSPLTSVHKVRYVQAEFVGSDVGDELGRIYLTPKGTSVVRSVEGGKKYFGFPERTAVVNTFFNGAKSFDEAMYTNVRLRDRPLINTRWDVVINQKDELVNKDVNLNSLTDVRLYIGYTDFTNL